MNEGFYKRAMEHPDRLAVVQDEPPLEITYGDLAGRVNQVSDALADLPPGAVVSAVLTNRIELLIVELGTVQLPLYFTPINWHLATPEIAHIVGDSEAQYVFTETALVETVAPIVEEGLIAEGRLVVVDGAGEASLEEFLTGRSTEPPTQRGAGQRMLYTSGTTGHPKGVYRSLKGGVPEDHLGVLNTRARLYNVDHEAGVHLVTAPMYHAAPGAYASQALHLGHTVVMNRDWDPRRALEQIERYGVTNTYMVPTMFNRLLELPDEERKAADVSSLRSVIHTAAPCPVHVKQQMMDWFGPILYEIYGGTEGGATVVTPTEWLDHPGTVGRARPGVELRILGDDGQELGPGQEGEIYMSIPAQAFQYHRDEAKTRSSRRGDFFTLGDIGYLDDDGFLFLRDRAADVIVSGGVNIYPAEVESALLTHPEVVDAAVVGAPDDDWGERVTAFVVLAEGGSPVTPESLADHCRSRIAGFKCPRSIVIREELPRSDVGKLLRRQLRNELWEDRGVRL